MQLVEALRRVGATVVKEKPGERTTTLYLRVDLEQGAKWSDLITEFLLVSQKKPFTVDISKYFYAADGAVLYLWRLVLSGNLEAATTMLGSVAIQVSVAHAPEVTSIPLVGRIKYELDPARGKLKGSHGIDDAPVLISMAVGGAVGTGGAAA